MKTKKKVQKPKATAMKHQSTPRQTKMAVVLVVCLLFGALGLHLLTKSSAATYVNVNAATYNILGQHHDPTTRLDPWYKRKARVSNKISALNPGIIGMQEVTYINPLNGKISPQRYDVVSFMKAKGYSFYTGSPRNNSPVFWKRSNFTVLAKKEVQIVPMNSKAQGPAARYLTFVRLRKGGKNISVFNYHFNQYRYESRQYTMLKEYYYKFKGRGDHVIFTGDFNKRDLQVRNITGLWRIDNHTGIDHVLGSHNILRRSWVNTGKGSPAASDHPLIGVSVSLK